MTIIKSHNGKWDENKDLIDPTSSRDQHVGSTTPYLGLDTEFLVKKEGKVLWPWEQKLPQERDLNSPFTTDEPRYYDFHGDGFATELCIVPNYCLDLIMESLGMAFYWLGKKEGKQISAPAIYSIPEEVERSAPEEAKQLGCMPSLNAYGDRGNPSSLGKDQRTTGCHLHISHPSLVDQDIALALVKWADILVGCTWTYISPNPSKAESERRKAYGRAGEFRLKKYPAWPEGLLPKEYGFGVEYRVLPGTPMQHPAYLTLMYSLYRSALRLAVQYGEPIEELAAQAKEAINQADKTEAKKVIRSMPISSGGRKLIRFLRRVPLKIEQVSEWYMVSSRRQGHQNLYVNRNIKDRLLSL